MKGEWEGELYKEVEIHVPERMVKLLKALDNVTETEWVVFLKVKEIVDNKVFIDESEYFIPEQEATYSTVEPVEDIPKGFDVAVHKHPRSVTSFSSTDEKNINANSFISILWEDQQFKNATIKLYLGNTPIMVDGRYVKIVVDEELPDVSGFISKIRKKEYKTISYSGYDYSYGYGYYSYREADDVKEVSEEINKEVTHETVIHDIDIEILEAVDKYLEMHRFNNSIDLDDLKNYIKEVYHIEATDERIEEILREYGYVPEDKYDWYSDYYSDL